MGAVYLKELLPKTSREKEMVLQREGFQRKVFPLENINGQSSLVVLI